MKEIVAGNVDLSERALSHLKSKGIRLISAEQKRKEVAMEEKKVKKVETSKVRSERMKKVQAEKRKEQGPSKTEKLREMITKGAYAVKELAEATGCSINTVKVQLSFHLPKAGWKIEEKDGKYSGKINKK
jgi:DNA-binding Xre family transcriptional regulator